MKLRADAMWSQWATPNVWYSYMYGGWEFGLEVGPFQLWLSAE